MEALSVQQAKLAEDVSAGKPSARLRNAPEAECAYKRNISAKISLVELACVPTGGTGSYFEVTLMFLSVFYFRGRSFAAPGNTD